MVDGGGGVGKGNRHKGAGSAFLGEGCHARDGVHTFCCEHLEWLRGA